MITDRAPPSSRSTIVLDGIDTASLQRIADIDPLALEKIVTAIATAQKTLRSQRSLTGLAAASKTSSSFAILSERNLSSEA